LSLIRSPRRSIAQESFPTDHMHAQILLIWSSSSHVTCFGSFLTPKLSGCIWSSNKSFDFSMLFGVFGRDVGISGSSATMAARFSARRLSKRAGGFHLKISGYKVGTLCKRGRTNHVTYLSGRQRWCRDPSA
jgi:hypothetical protein